MVVDVASKERELALKRAVLAGVIEVKMAVAEATRDDRDGKSGSGNSRRDSNGVGCVMCRNNSNSDASDGCLNSSGGKMAAMATMAMVTRRSAEVKTCRYSGEAGNGVRRNLILT